MELSKRILLFVVVMGMLGLEWVGKYITVRNFLLVIIPLFVSHAGEATLDWPLLLVTQLSLLILLGSRNGDRKVR